jgi:hypothetical protein
MLLGALNQRYLVGAHVNTISGVCILVEPEIEEFWE